MLPSRRPAAQKIVDQMGFPSNGPVYMTWWNNVGISFIRKCIRIYEYNAKMNPANWCVNFSTNVIFQSCTLLLSFSNRTHCGVCGSIVCTSSHPPTAWGWKGWAVGQHRDINHAKCPQCCWQTRFSICRSSLKKITCQPASANTVRVRCWYSLQSICRIGAWSS